MSTKAHETMWALLSGFPQQCTRIKALSLNNTAGSTLLSAIGSFTVPIPNALHTAVTLAQFVAGISRPKV